MATYPAEDIRRSLRAVTQVEPNDMTQAAGGAATGVLRNVPPSGAEMRSLDASRAVQRNRPQLPNGYRPVVAASDALRGSTALGAGGAALAAAPEALRTGRVLDNKNATWNDVGTQLAEGAGRVGAAGAGAAAGATLGAGVAPFLGPFAPVAPVIGGLAGGAYGYFAGDKAIRGLRNAFGLDARSPDERLGVAPTGAAVAGTPPPATPMPATPTDSGLPNALNQPAGPTGVLPRPSAASDYGMGAQPGAAPAQPNVLRTDSRDVGNVVPGYGAEARAIDARTRQINDEMAATQRYLDKFGPGPNGGGVGGFGGATQSSELRRQFDETPSASVLSRNGMSGYQSAQLQLQREQLAEARADRGERRALTAAGQNNTLAIAQMNSETARRSNDQNNATTLRGQDLDYGAKLLPVQQAEAQRQRLAALMQASGSPEKARDNALRIGDTASAKLLTEQITSGQALSQAQDAQAQTRSKTALDIFAPGFTTTKTDAQGNTTSSFDEVGAKKALAVARGIYGEQFERMTPEQQRAIAPQIIAKVQNQTAETQVAPGWLDRAKRVVGMYEEPPTVTAPRDLRGGTLSRAGLLDSVPTNNWMVKLPNGQVIDYRNATADQLKELEPRLRP